ncbi:MAG: ABC transporter substrate-binding protein, partial [Bifidobacteriaceae bacterium]|nr:ABC transporter substrate-binding protein [Bifidobacteriaceae bacterium]
MRQLIPATRNPLPRPEGQTPSGQARGHLGSLSGRLAALTALMAGALALAACGGGPDAKPDAASDPGSAGDQTMAAQDAAQVVVEDNHGSITVPVNPERVVALDNRAFELLSRWDVPLVAAPKSLMGNGLFPKYSGDDSLPDVGTHREPNLEVIAAAEPDLVIGGMRFSSHYDAIKQLDPSVPVIELSPRDG